ncbi:lipocalin-like domain-containing protein [Phyllobacterium zundukense]|uniref:lipocalin-like domain-containing protein n=1 Tax=Phyllobacterium zundukense TaxID=1867719 RepID=UPI001F2483FF|nr:lipocalin-like domain-containing protein [Phyllobacterium zundukense]
MKKEILIGTWRLVSSTRTILDTGEVVNSYGGRPNGWINYGGDGRMMVVVAHDGRPKLADPLSLTDVEQAALFKTFFAYAGTYDLEEGSIVHYIDTSWNETWSGTQMKRNLVLSGQQVVYTTEPFAFSGDGRESVVTLVWEKYDLAAGEK